MIAKPANRTPEAPHRWSPANDYLDDPAVAPLRALLAALVRRMTRSRRSAPPREERPAPPSVRNHSPA